ncbi:hypothetical protein [Brevibacterium epidermidis]|uniref:hypothetical protein n=1 Tax=Brevibacterium epidermidis TaxID=1698 RepID=UPI001F52C457
MTATPTTQPPHPQPFAIWNPETGCWETSRLDLFGRSEPYSVIWPTSGTTRNGSAYPPHSPVPHTLATVSSSSRTAKALFRTLRVTASLMTERSTQRYLSQA